MFEMSYECILNDLKNVLNEVDHEIQDISLYISIIPRDLERDFLYSIKRLKNIISRLRQKKKKKKKTHKFQKNLHDWIPENKEWQEKWK